MSSYPGETLIVKKRGGGERAIPPSKWWIDRNTPVGDDADLYERMPYGGQRLISRSTIIRREQVKETIK